MRIYKEITNLEIADLLRAVAASYQIDNKEANKFKIIAYERAADAVEHASSELKDLWDEGKLTTIPGIGPSIAQHLEDIFKTGKSAHFVEVMKNIPSQVFELLEIAGVGPKTAIKLIEELHIPQNEPVNFLRNACEKDLVSKIEGFGKDSQKEILTSIKEIQNRPKRHLLNYAVEISKEVMDWMMKSKSVKRIDALGSLRRMVSTVGDVDIAVSTPDPKGVITHFSKYPKATRVIEIGERTSSILLPGGVQVDIMAQDSESYGSLLQHFTGSKHHNIALREYALRKGLSLSEYGIKELKNENLKVKTFKTEEDFYKFLKMNWIPPELREDTGEIEAAINSFNKKDLGLPNLLEPFDVKADLQIHSDFDVETSHDLGESTMEELVEKADFLGYEYIAFTDHNPSFGNHKEKDFIRILEERKKTIDKLNYSLGKSIHNRVKKVYNSLEIDILANGDLSIPESALDLLDFALVSIHSAFKQSKEDATKRVLKALSHKKAKIFAHPTGRKLTEREGIELNWPEIFEFCIQNNKWLEVNADPMRLDLPDFLVKDAVKASVKITFGTDSHHKDMMNNMPFAVSVARRGWASKEDVINTLDLKSFEKLLE